MKSSRFFGLIFAFAIGLPILCSVLETIWGTSAVDAAMFRYLGWNVANGGGYDTAWDCKGPILIFVEAIGYVLAPESHYGPTWVLCGLWCVTLILLYALARRFMSCVAAVVVIAVFSFVQLGVLSLRAMNCQEIPAILLALCGVCCALKGRWWDGIIVGACGACVFLIKANLCSFGIGIFVYWLMRSIELRNYKVVVQNSLTAATAFLITLGGVTLWFAPDGMSSMWDAALFYNLFERNLGIELSWVEWWKNYLAASMSFNYRESFFLFAWFVVVSIAYHGAFHMREKRPEIGLLVTWLSCEIAMAFVSKGFFTHYLMLTLVPMGILIGILYERRAKFEALAAAAFLSLSVSYEYPLACYQMYVANRLCHETYKEVAPALRGQTVAVCGGLGSAELMGRLRLKTLQRYFCWLMWIDHASENRKKEMIDSFARALFDKNVSWLISDIPIERIPGKAMDRADVLQGLSFYRFVAQGKCPHVYLYKKCVE